MDLSLLFEPTWWTSARLTALAAVLTFIVAAVAAVIAVRQLRHTVTDSRARSRPIVTANLVRTPYTKSYALQITNSGPSAARALTVTFNPALPTAPRTTDGQTSVIGFMADRYADPIPVLPPGATLSNVYFVGTARGGKIVNAENTPSQVTVSVAYADDEGRPYTDAFPLDVAILQKESESVGSNSPEKQREKALKDLDQLVGWAKVTAQSVDDLTELGLRYRSRRADRRRAAERRRQEAEHNRFAAEVLGRELPAEGKPDRLRRNVASGLRAVALRVQP